MSGYDLGSILQYFKVENTNSSFQPITHGYINDTYLVSISNRPKFILQRINHNVFENYEILQKNIDIALEALNDEGYSKIEFIKTKDNSSLAKIDGNIWRLMTYIENSKTYNTTTDSKIAFEAGKIIGLFHNLLSSEQVENYDDVIESFHYLPLRKQQFTTSINEADEADKKTAEFQINFALENLPKFDAFYEADLPIRVCHNDTKLNNILFDESDSALCLIDLDTIMKGHIHYDFGDATRTIVNSAVEDEKDLSKINFSESQFKQVVDGLYYSGLKLSQKELNFLPIATALMPFLHGLRALTDYLNKNRYYKVSYPEQNLDRCKSLFQYAFLAFNKQDFMANYLEKVYK